MKINNTFGKLLDSYDKILINTFYRCKVFLVSEATRRFRLTFYHCDLLNVQVKSGNLPLRPWLKFMTWEGALATVFITITGGAFLTGLALMLGANDFEIGLLAAIPYLLQLIQLFAAYIIDQTGYRKSITVWSSAAGRQIWWLILPLLLLNGDWRLTALLAIVVLSNICMMAANAGWMSWVADLVPGRIRGRYFGDRNAAVAISTISASITAGIILDRFRSIQKENLGFFVIIGVACLFALAAVILLNRVPDNMMASKIGIGWSYMIRPLKNKEFRYLIKIFFAWNLAIGIAAPFFAAHMLTNLQMSFTQVALYSALGALVTILLTRPWGALIDRFGNKPIAAFCAVGIAFIPLIWWIPRPGHLWILFWEAIYSGALWAGFNLALFNIPIANSPRRERTIYLAMFSVVTGLAFFGSSVLGGMLAENWRHIHWALGKQTVVNYHLLFTLSSLLRLLAAMLILTFHEPKEKAMPAVIHFMEYSIFKWFSAGYHSLPYLFRRGRKPGLPKE